MSLLKHAHECECGNNIPIKDNWNELVCGVCGREYENIDSYEDEEGYLVLLFGLRK